MHMNDIQIDEPKVRAYIQDFLEKYDEKLIYGKKYIIAPAKIYTIILIISSAFGLIKLLI